MNFVSGYDSTLAGVFQPLLNRRSSLCVNFDFLFRRHERIDALGFGHPVFL